MSVESHEWYTGRKGRGGEGGEIWLKEKPVVSILFYKEWNKVLKLKLDLLKISAHSHLLVLFNFHFLCFFCGRITYDSRSRKPHICYIIEKNNVIDRQVMTSRGLRPKQTPKGFEHYTAIANVVKYKTIYKDGSIQQYVLTILIITCICKQSRLQELIASTISNKIPQSHLIIQAN